MHGFPSQQAKAIPWFMSDSFRRCRWWTLGSKKNYENLRSAFIFGMETTITSLLGGSSILLAQGGDEVSDMKKRVAYRQHDTNNVIG
mmetsp:Transcript_33021/g.79850  ORF Transcript_33021/g.79850 Transcript_33021/m.79850 type:complete len:87 (-) Transcript_33021:8-268(-)